MTPEVLAFLVIVPGAIWFGGSIASTLLGARIASSKDAGALGRFAKEYVQLAPGLFGGSGFLALTAGIWFVASSKEIGFGTPWAILALVLWFVSIVLAATVVGFSWTRVAVALGHAVGEEGGARTPSVDSANAPTLVRKALRLSWVDIAIRTVVLLLVFWQPGS